MGKNKKSAQSSKKRRRKLSHFKNLWQGDESKRWTPPAGIDPGVFFSGIKTKKGREEFFMEAVSNDNKTIPAGYVYLGQLIAHDMTFDPKTESASSHYKASENVRTPLIDLDSVYGKEAPVINKSYYDQSKYFGRTHFLIGKTAIKGAKRVGGVTYSVTIFDLARKDYRDGRAIPLIPDQRNDENILVSQLHLVIQLFHNKLVQEKIDASEPLRKLSRNNLVKWGSKFELFANKNLDSLDGVKLSRDGNYISIADLAMDIPIGDLEFIAEYTSSKDLDTENLFVEYLEAKVLDPKVEILDEIFRATRKEVKHYFQWAVLYDFLPKVVGNDLVEKILGIDSIKEPQKTDKRKKSDRRIFTIKYKKDAFIPGEFGMAAFRFGHSMIRDAYQFGNLFAPIHDNKRSKASIIFQPKQPGYRSEAFYVDWSLFFYPSTSEGGNPSAKIHPQVRPFMLNSLPVFLSSRNIVFRNLLSGYQSRLYHGQAIAVIANEQVEEDIPIVNSAIFQKEAAFLYNTLAAQFPLYDVGENRGQNLFDEFCDRSPLWFYLLMEAAVYGEKGSQLGPLGARIVAEVIIGLIEVDKAGVLKAKNWEPSIFDDLTPVNEAEPDNDQQKGDNSMIKFVQYAGVYDGAFTRGNDNL